MTTETTTAGDQPPITLGELLAAAAVVSIHAHPDNRDRLATRLEQLADWLNLHPTTTDKES